MTPSDRFRPSSAASSVESPIASALAISCLICGACRSGLFRLKVPQIAVLDC